MRREEQISRNDIFPKVSNTIIDIDETILKYIIDKIKPTVIDNGVQITVPVMFASPERWKSARKDGYLRDQNGKIQKPIFILKRNSFSKNDSLFTLNRYLDTTFKQVYSKKNSYDQFSVLNRKREEHPTQEIYNVTLPDHIIVNYEGVIWTDGVEQNNSVCEKLNFAVDDYWGVKGSPMYRTEISDYSTQTEVIDDKERVVRTTFNLMVYAHLLPEKFEDGRSIVKKELTPRKLIITEHVGYPPKEKFPPTDSLFVNPNKNKGNPIKSDTIGFFDR